jgi:hypothetical protein
MSGGGPEKKRSAAAARNSTKRARSQSSTLDQTNAVVSFSSGVVSRAARGVASLMSGAWGALGAAGA